MEYILSSGDIENGIILENDTMTILDGGIAIETTDKSGGSLDVSSVVTVMENTAVYFKAIDASCNESEVIADPVTSIEETYEIISGEMFQDDNICGIDSGYLYLDATIHEAVVYLLSGGMTSRATIASSGCSRFFNTWLVVESGGTALDTTVNSGGELLMFGGYADGAVISSGGVLGFGSGTATNISAMAGANMDIRVMPESYLQVVSAGSAFEIKDGIVSGLSSFDWRLDVESGGIVKGNSIRNYVYLSSGGTANSNTIEGGAIYVYGGAQANDTTLDRGGLYVSHGGQATGTTVNNGRLDISAGGVANSAIISSGASLYVLSGGTATNITASSGAQLTLAVASDTYVQGTYDGSAFELKDASLSDYTITSWGGVSVSSGGTATNIRVNTYAYITVSSGGTANHVSANGGQVYLEGGGTLDRAVVNGGDLYISSGGTATNIEWTPLVGNVTIENGAYVTFAGEYSGVYYEENGSPSSGQSIDSKRIIDQSVYVMSGGTATNTGIGNWGSMYVSSGGMAGNTVVSSGGALYVYDSGIANRVTVSSGGGLYVSSGGTATNVVWTPCEGSIFIENDANVTFASRYSGVYVSSAGQAVSNVLAINSQTISSMDACVMTDGIADHVTVDYGGSVNLFDGGIATGTLITSLGRLIISSGGTASQTTVDSFGYLDVYNGGVANDTVLNRGIKVDSYTWSGGTMFIFNGGTANDVKVHCGAEIIVFSGGTVNSARLSSGYKEGNLGVTGGTLVVSSGGVANNTTVCEGPYDGGYNGGYFVVSSGGTANQTTVQSNGNFRVQSGGTALYTVVSPHGSMGAYGTIKHTIISGGHNCDPSMLTGSADDTILAGATLGIHCGTATNTVIKSGGYLVVNYWAGYDRYYPDTVYSGIANGVLIESGGALSVSSGGTATNIVASKGAIISFDITDNTYLQGTYDGSAFEIKDATLSSFDLYGNIRVSSGKHVNDITVHSGGGVIIFSDACGDGIVLSGGSLYILDGAVTNTTVSSGGKLMMYAYQDGDNDLKWVGLSGHADNTVVESGGHLDICGTTMNNTTVKNGGHFCLSGYYGTASDTTVNSGGELNVAFEAKLTGRITLEKGAYVDVGSDAIIDFDLTQTSAGAAVLVNGLSIIRGTPIYTLTVDGSVAGGVYSLAAGAQYFASTISVVNTAGDELGVLTVGETVSIGQNDYTLNLNEGALTVTIEVPDLLPTNLVGTADGVSWDSIGANYYLLEYSQDDFAHVLVMATPGTAVDTLNLPGGTYQWRVKVLDDGADWAVGEDFVSENEPGTAKVVRSNADGVDDIFFASANGTWSREYFAQHAGSLDEVGWTGTGEFISANGKGRIQNLFFGSSDPSILCLTDAENGDAIFLDDVYTELPEELKANTARLLRIREIWAGAGDDIIDMTSQRFEYVGDGQAISGGDGNDVIWANKGANWLFGDAGDDRITGASGDDVIAGGIGDDRMHGGGGNDVFTFCENWGIDTVKQLGTGTVTLWFASGIIDNWDEETLTYSDGTNSVKVSGVTAEQVTLKFDAGTTPDDADQFASLSSMGAFEAFTTRKIFEEATLA